MWCPTVPVSLATSGVVTVTVKSVAVAAGMYGLFCSDGSLTCVSPKPLVSVGGPDGSDASACAAGAAIAIAAIIPTVATTAFARERQAVSVGFIVSPQSLVGGRCPLVGRGGDEEEQEQGRHDQQATDDLAATCSAEPRAAETGNAGMTRGVVLGEPFGTPGC